MRNKKIFVLKIVWRKSIAWLHRLTQAVQRANLKRTAGDLTWVFTLHTGPEMSVSSIAGNESQTRVDFGEREEKGKNAKSQSFYQLSYWSSFLS